MPDSTITEILEDYRLNRGAVQLGYYDKLDLAQANLDAIVAALGLEMADLTVTEILENYRLTRGAVQLSHYDKLDLAQANLDAIAVAVKAGDLSIGEGGVGPAGPAGEAGPVGPAGPAGEALDDTFETVSLGSGYVWDWETTRNIGVSLTQNAVIGVVGQAAGTQRLLRVTQPIAGDRSLSIPAFPSLTLNQGAFATSYFRLFVDDRGFNAVEKLDITAQDNASPYWSPYMGTANTWLNAENLSSGAIASWPSEIGNTVYEPIDGPTTPTATDATFNGRRAAVFRQKSLQAANPKTVKACMFVVRELGDTQTNLVISDAPSNPINSAFLRIGGTYDASLDGAGFPTNGQNEGLIRVNGQFTENGENVEIAGFAFNTSDTYIIYLQFKRGFSARYLGGPGTGNMADYKLGEMLIWEDQPAQLEIEQSYGWLAHRWGAPLPVGHPFESRPPLIGEVPFTPTVTNSAELIAALDAPGNKKLIKLAAGTYTLPSQKTLSTYSRLIGEGAGQTIIQGDPSWQPSFDPILNNPRGNESADVETSYLLKMNRCSQAENLTLAGPALHGGIYINYNDSPVVRNCEVKDFGWVGIRARNINDLRVEDCTFLDAGRARNQNGQDNIGAGVYGRFLTNTVVKNSYFIRDTANNHYGFRSDGASGTLLQNCEFSLKGSFAIEVPHENTDFNNRVYNCLLEGAISVPKNAGGGTVGASSFTVDPVTGAVSWTGQTSWEIRHSRWRRTSYGAEMDRNSFLIRECVADFEASDNNARFLMDYGSDESPGPMAVIGSMLRVSRGAAWTVNSYQKLHFEHNLIESTVDSISEDLFTIGSDPVKLATCKIQSNVINLTASAKGVFNNATARANVNFSNNTVTGATDSGYVNSDTGNPRGPIIPLVFNVGVDGRWAVDGFALELEVD